MRGSKVLIVIGIVALVGHLVKPALGQGFRPLIYGQADGPTKPTGPAVQVPVSKELIEAISKWDKRIWFFTSKNHPIRSLSELRQDRDLGMWGQEHFDRFKEFAKLAGYSKNPCVIGIGEDTRLFSAKQGAPKPPRLFFTWSANAPHIVDGIRVEFVDKPTPRKWTDSSGKYTVEADFVDFKDGKVQLRKHDGKTVTVPIEKLSQADRSYVRTVSEGVPPSRRKKDNKPNPWPKGTGYVTKPQNRPASPHPRSIYFTRPYSEVFVVFENAV